MIVPYVLTDKWSIPEEEIRKAFRITKDEGSLEKVFLSGRIRTEDQFLSYMQDRKNLPVFIFEPEISGYAWINGIHSSYAFVHCCFFKNIWGKNKHIVDSIVSYWFSFTGNDGKPLFKTLMASVSLDNKPVNKFLLRNGFTLLGAVPNIGYDGYRNLNVPMNLLYRCNHDE